MKYSSTWRSPSNIALIKYWGKYATQIPANPSLSFTLQNCYTQTSVEVTPTDSFSVRIFLDEDEKPEFLPKINKFMDALGDESDFLKNCKITIRTHNSFPHSSGIASSASGMSALALCLLRIKEQVTEKPVDSFFETASRWSRLGSGSASRSVYGGLVEWGLYPGLKNSSDEFAIPYPKPVHKVFADFRDYVLLVEVGSKAVSSTAGHGLMNGHPYAERRFLQAHENLSKLETALAIGALPAFGDIVEQEALALHAMMLTSVPSFILMKPGTLAVMEEIRNMRQKSNLPVYFTLDAGANVHLLFPAKDEIAVNEFVKKKLVRYLKNEQYICDRVGQGPQEIKA